MTRDWTAGSDAVSERQLVDASFELSEAARKFDQTSGLQSTAPATAAVLASTTAALNSQADAVHRMRSLIRFELAPADARMNPSADVEQLHEMLGVLEENLRFSAGQADRARHLARAILKGESSPGSAPQPPLEVRRQRVLAARS